MNELNVAEPDALSAESERGWLETSNRRLERLSAEERVAWSLERLPGRFVLSTSFGIQAPVALHLVTRLEPDIPVVFIDTGYLFPETYQFADELTERLRLNLKVYRSDTSSAWLEARHGRLWEQGVDGLDRYHRIVKVEPMQRALCDLEAGTWFTGLRRSQSRSRAHLPVLELHRDRFKVHPTADWSNREVHLYLKAHDLPYHPLREKGYASVGDSHTTRPLEPGMSEEETRFHGLKRECGLHEL